MSDAVWEIVGAEDVRHRPFLDGALDALQPDERAAMDAYVEHLRADGLSDARIAECYLTIVGDTLREQIFFRRHKRYRHSTYAEVAESVYHDPDYMTRYMVGLGLTTYVWPNHVAMRRFAEAGFPAGRGGAYLEVGPGHGLFFAHAMQTGGYGSYLGVDVSATSLALTKALLTRRLGELPDAVSLIQTDFLASELPPGPFDAIVMGEVLEHVEQPGAFLDRIASLSGPATWIHLTTCLNSPAIDHITLFRDQDAVRDLFSAAGLAVVDELAIGHIGTTLEESIKRELPINVAYTLRRTP